MDKNTRKEVKELRNQIKKKFNIDQFTTIELGLIEYFLKLNNIDSCQLVRDILRSKYYNLTLFQKIIFKGVKI